MRKNKVSDWELKEIKKKKEDERMRKLDMQRTSFDTKANNQPKKTFRWVNTSILRTRHPYMPKGYVLEFIVMLEDPLPRNVVESKLDRAFGYLKKQEEVKK